MFRVWHLYGQLVKASPRLELPYHKTFASATSSSKNGIKKSDITKYIKYREVLEPRKVENKQMLVLLFTWIGSKQAAYDKYCQLYHARGWDVIEITGSIKYVLKPTVAQTVVNDLLQYMRDSTTDHKQIIMHSASIGVFLHSLMTKSMKEDMAVYSGLMSKIAGQILDSPTLGDPQEWNEATVNSITHNRVAQIALRSLCSLLWTPKHVKVFADTQDYFAKNIVSSPLLYLCARNDPMHSVAMAEPIITDLKKRMPVTYQCWEQSQHAAHMYMHETEYRALHDQFLEHHILNSQPV